ncbi:glutamyl-tRNA reductase [Suttonella ornithocola]|uniref:Glutamyl-tRNA reductase n=1 Tax=Suttonella ornithocola TaxID=279832 RepID=A0A380MPY4_9GAMM|nr:glutamyl-tRNA reductase [Suttonella ornithocola]SUO93761.1 Glutamyl-tRNA reductase [Suttonella ornithocola]
MSHTALQSSLYKKTTGIFVFGLNHQSATVAVREKLAFSPVQSQAILENIRQDFPKMEAALLSTCNRTEWLFCADSAPDFTAWLAKKGYAEEAALRSSTFFYRDREAVRHLYRVACGLDSLILGEPQILGQLKAAYRLAKQTRTIGSSLERLFQQSFAIAKHIRHSTGIGENPVSVAYAGVKLTHQFFDDHERRTAMVIGAGETGQLTARYLKDLNVRRIIIANRSLERAQLLAEEVGGYAVTLKQIPDHLYEADMVFGAVQAEQYLLTQADVQRSLKKRRQSFQVLVDLSMPRIFESDIEQLPSAFLYSVDDLEQIIDHNKETRQKAARQAEVMINLYSDDFIGWLRSKPQQQLIRQIREQANQTRQELLADAYRRLAHGEDPAILLEQLSYKLTNKLLHSPSAMIHAIPPDHKDWLAIVADTFETDRHH